MCFFECFTNKMGLGCVKLLLPQVYRQISVFHQFTMASIQKLTNRFCDYKSYVKIERANIITNNNQ